MSSDFNINKVFYLFIVSILAIFSHRMGAFDIELSLLDNESVNVGYGGVSNTRTNLTYRDDIPYANCNLTVPEGYNLCGVSINLGKDASDGKDLSHYKNIEINVKVKSPIAKPKVRFVLRNYNSNYSKLDDDVTLKFNSIAYIPDNYQGTITVPLKSFQVETWWIDQFNIGFNDAQLDFSNVSYAEIITDDMPVIGNYTITVEKATLHGELISETELLQVILLFWLSAIIILITLQRNKLNKVASTDVLTKLLNRRGASSWVAKNLPKFGNSLPLTMFYIDFDDFKKINDSFGHLVGDELLCQFSLKVQQTIQNYIASKFMMARLSGDEFCIVLKGVDEQTKIDLANSLFTNIAEGIALSVGDIKLSISVGIATSESDTTTFESLMSRADSAMYHAKKRGKNQFKIFDESVSKDILFRKQVAEKIRTALREDHFTLNFMPIYHVDTLKIYGAEVLLRCSAKSLQGIGPDIFIPIAEEFGIIKDIDLWVIESTFRIIAENKQLFEQVPLTIAINISSIELHNSHFTRDLKKLISKYTINTQYIEMEITETSLVETDELSISILNEIRELGIRLALDDFGTGYTAFSQLINYPVDCLKIDKSFIDDLLLEKESQKTMLKAIFSIAKAYKLTTIGEGVEEIEQYQYIKDRNCDLVQGYLFSKPLNWSSFIQEIEQPKKINLL
ncbi:bifunctional diguanylate cyclase/phosphodiesterase [Paraglaciecola sp. L3A3]|uniref:putative bifunctional diguanylate cyclase/phosphodiesterase n=1 Tax=Paraglaciecola sp. L3A3 TaxID=2686358 RepID=UPI00131CA5C5|nr:bifunctional diguanylate cyclase/phosphodiesterase [Paraglaciecola sp. L3A3]